ncbi:Mobile element protein [Methanosarcina barkeri 227]|uniref:Mobile element protein n=1 Tax=Methanosarcina barkeri 227 TaxID=1434106 RepID=A0A0E3R3K4_METBA|nr:Mobile element protein [Methanosarcina barkeri 227]
MRWIFFKFQGITELITQKRENKVRNTEYGRNSLENIEFHRRERLSIKIR